MLKKEFDIPENWVILRTVDKEFFFINTLHLASLLLSFFPPH
jgi:hypothetical protein